MEAEEEELMMLTDDEGANDSCNYLAIVYDNRTLGAACFDLVTTKLYTLFVPCEGESQMEHVLERLKYQFDPCLILVPSICALKHNLLDRLKQPQVMNADEYRVRVLKNAHFNYQKCCHDIESVIINGCERPLLHSKRDLYKYLTGFIDFDQTQTVRAIGGLLKHLKSEKVINQLDYSIHLNTIESIALDGYMYLDPMAFQSLHIFNRESHPSATGRAKEGFSLYSLLQRTVSKPGTKLLRQWMLHPLVDLSKIRQRHAAVGVFTLEEHQESVKLIVGHLRQFRDVSQVLYRFKTAGGTNPKDWIALYRSVERFLLLKPLVTFNLELLTTFRHLPRVAHVFNLLGNVIDFEETQTTGVIVIQPGISEELDFLRHVYDQMDQVLLQTAMDLQSRCSIESLLVQYIPQAGYVVRLNAATPPPKDFIFQFQHEDQLFYKTQECKALDHDPGDLYGILMDMQLSILTHLSKVLLEFEPDLHAMAHVVATLDCLVAFARVSNEYGYVCPTMHSDPCTLLRQARHPLQELLVETYIPNDIELNRTTSLIALITGPNCSGKSTMTKLIALNHYMAQIGSFIPCESAELGIVTKLLTRIQSIETSTTCQSTFTIDCTQIAFLLNQADDRSLLVIDEFGKGTAHLDGLALFIALIRYLASCDPMPRILVTTHFLQAFSYLPPCDFYKMTMVSQDNMSFRIEKGIETSSKALLCAKNAQVPDRVLDKATSFKQVQEQDPIRQILLSVKDWTIATEQQLERLRV